MGVMCDIDTVEVFRIAIAFTFFANDSCGTSTKLIITASKPKFLFVLGGEFVTRGHKGDSLKLILVERKGNGTAQSFLFTGGVGAGCMVAVGGAMAVVGIVGIVGIGTGRAVTGGGCQGGHFETKGFHTSSFGRESRG